jgi:hypothetical protein
MKIRAVDGKLVGEYPRVWEGDFNCEARLLTTLEGCPEIINGGFYCEANYLESLKGCPKEVISTFYCCQNDFDTIQNINQHVKKIGGMFIADDKLTGLISILLIDHPPVEVIIGPIGVIFNKALKQIRGGKDRHEAILDVIINCPEEYAWQLGEM